MFSISFVVCIISTILFVQTRHCEEQSPIAAPAAVMAGNTAKVETASGVKSTKNDSTASSSNPTKGSSVEPKELAHSRTIKNTSTDFAPPIDQLDSEETVQAVNGAKLQVAEKESVMKDKKNTAEELPSANSDSAKSNQTNDAKGVQNQTVSTNTSAKPAFKPLLSTSIMTTSTTTSTSTTTTPAPKKPTVTFSVEDVPDLLNSARKTSIQELKDDDTQPRLLQSSESVSDRASGHDFLVPVIGMIFIIPLLIIVANCTARRARDYWSKRKYRRMDYLIEDMYN